MAHSPAADRSENGSSPPGPDPSDTRLAAAIEQRRRKRFLEAQAAEDGTFSGVLHDLAERAAPVVVLTAAGNEHSGHVAALGVDFATLTGDGRETVVRLAAIRSVTVADTAAVVGDRGDLAEVRLIDVLATMGPERPTLRVCATGGHEVRGILHAVGRDVIRLRTQMHESVYIPVVAIEELVVGS